MIKVNLGCWKRNFGPDWVHIDGCDLPHITSHDVVNLPFEDNSVDLIYASHLFEYFDRNEGIEVLFKWYAKLKIGGELRIGVPDFDSLISIYHRSGDLEKILGPLYGRMQLNDGLIYHKTVYNQASLHGILSDAGFIGIERYDWRETEDGKFDDHSKAHYPHDMEAIKSMKFDSKFIPVSLNMRAFK